MINKIMMTIMTFVFYLEKCLIKESEITYRKSQNNSINSSSVKICRSEDRSGFSCDISSFSLYFHMSVYL